MSKIKLRDIFTKEDRYTVLQVLQGLVKAVDGMTYIDTSEPYLTLSPTSVSGANALFALDKPLEKGYYYIVVEYNETYLYQSLIAISNNCGIGSLVPMQAELSQQQFVILENNVFRYNTGGRVIPAPSNCTLKIYK